MFQLKNPDASVTDLFMVVSFFDGRDDWLTSQYLPALFERTDVAGVASRNTNNKSGKGQMGVVFFNSFEGMVAFEADMSDVMEAMRADALTHGFRASYACEVPGYLEVESDRLAAELWLIVGVYHEEDSWLVDTHLPQMIVRTDVVGVVQRPAFSETEGDCQLGFLLFETAEAAFAFAGDASEPMEAMRADARAHGFQVGYVCSPASVSGDSHTSSGPELGVERRGSPEGGAERRG